MAAVLVGRATQMILALALLAGCDDGKVDVRVYVPDSGDVLERLEVSVIAGCGTVEEIGDEPIDPIRVVDPLFDPNEPIGTLGEGAYGLYARAWTANCLLYAAGCDSFRIPDEDGIVDVTLSTIDTRGCPPGQYCPNGECVPGGGG